MTRTLLCALASAAVALAVTISEATLHQYDDGPALGANFKFGPGDPVWVSFRIAGYKKTEDDAPKVKMSWTVDVADAKGVRVVEPKAEVIEVTLAVEDKDWKPKKRHEFQLPPMIDSGGYTVTITVNDELAGQTVKRDVVFQVLNPLAVEPSPVLVARNFRFLRGEEDGRVASPAVYRKGDSVWARFEIAGFKLGEKNSYDVAYGLEVLRADGSRVYQEPEAAGERDSTYYPKRFVQGVLSLNLDKTIAPGVYTIVLRLADKTAGVRAESRHQFQVE
jgi:hypothetical protein